jgi:hypothetical protein
MLVYIYTQFLNPARSKVRVPGFDRVTRSAGSIPILKKNSKWRRFSKKKTKINGLQPSFWPGQLGHDFSYFFQPDPVPALGRPARPGRVSKLWFYITLFFYIINYIGNLLLMKWYAYICSHSIELSSLFFSFLNFYIFITNNL